MRCNGLFCNSDMTGSSRTVEEKEKKDNDLNTF